MAILAASMAVLSLSILIFAAIRLIAPVYMEKGEKLLRLNLSQKDYNLLSDGMLLGIIFGIESMVFSSLSISILTSGSVLPATAAAFFILQLLSLFVPMIWVLMPPQFLPKFLKSRD